MNWDAIGSVGEIIGALAVVISVFYLAFQIRKQTEESKLSATRDLANQHLDILKTLATDDRLPKIWLKGVRSYTSLDDEDRYRVSLIFHALIRNFEQQFIHARNSKAESVFIDSINREFALILSFPGFEEWWETSSLGYDNVFVEHLDKVKAVAKTMDFKSTFNKSIDL